MTTIASKCIIKQPIETVYNFLSDCNNHEQLMPENVYNWSSTTDEASFTVQNMTKLSLKIGQRIENKEILFVPVGEAPFDLSLTWKLNMIDATATEAVFTIIADLNMMMKMIASGPLKKLVDFETSKLKNTLET
ncbi:SRPBCC family protein [Olivibacter sp. SDN3]|uniref:SRPBCC family protein n=1 Tax=Olivibacter sp. SDN3 TaxID=2764720 RepID=UPI001650F324|nr:SRPBCC family protein [Olivibacter sp. SDN3]QNL48431.1 SRPBCC family protein [Olivibacter sp. SDN3]